MFNLKGILSEQSTEKKVFAGNLLLWSWRASLNDVITILERKLANHRSCTIIPPIKSRLSRPNAWSLIDSFPPWLGSTQFWSESQTWKTWKKSLLKAERILRSGDYFLFVCSGEFVVSVKKNDRHSVAKVFLLVAFIQLMSISLLKYWDFLKYSTSGFY